MPWVSLALAVIALPLVLLDRRWAIAALVLAAAIAVVLLVRSQHEWTARSAIAIALVAALFAGFTAYDLHRPSPSAAPDPAPYSRAADGVRTVVVPLTVQHFPVERLALLEFVDGADATLEGLEPQLVAGPDGPGMRVIAYRTDGYVDVYDDVRLPIDPDERQQVTGKGKLRHEQVAIENAAIEVDEQCRAHISFAFTDADGRAIAVDIHETTTRASVPTNLLAPVGSGSASPDFFPLFLLHDFEFVRLDGTRFDVSIDGRRVDLKPFPAPVPLQGQPRSFAKYTPDAEILALFPTTSSELQVVETEPGTDVARVDGAQYLFAGDALERILVGSTEIVFDPPLDVSTSGAGTVTATSYPNLGVIAGSYRVEVTGAAGTDDARSAHLEIAITRVEVPHQRDLVYRLFINERSPFGAWPLAYRFEARFDLGAGTIDARWTNAGA